MKKTLFTTMLASALLGGCGAALANTGYSQSTDIAVDSAPNHIYGVTSTDLKDALGADLTVYEGDSGFESLQNVVGGYVGSGKSAYENQVTMTGGKVTEMLVGGYVGSGGIAVDNCVVMTGGDMPGVIAGGYVNGARYAVVSNTVVISGNSTATFVYGGYVATGNAENNTVVLSGGKVSRRLVGGCVVWEGDACGNTVIVNGGSAIDVCAGLSDLKANNIKGNKVVITGGEVETARAYNKHSFQTKYENNVIIMSGGKAGALMHAERIHLAGVGFSGAIEGVKEIEGKTLDCGSVGSCESIDIYGTEIFATGLSAGLALNFHLLAGQLTESAPMVTLSDTFRLSADLKLSFDALENMEWNPGDSVSLVQAQQGMTVAPELLAREYDIYENGDPKKIMAVARLELEQGLDTTQFLNLVLIREVPEPATGTLSLLALAALAARRRRK